MSRYQSKQVWTEHKVAHLSRIDSKRNRNDQIGVELFTQKSPEILNALLGLELFEAIRGWKNSPEITKADDDEFQIISSNGIITKTNSGESNHWEIAWIKKREISYCKYYRSWNQPTYTKQQNLNEIKPLLANFRGIS